MKNLILLLFFILGLRFITLGLYETYDSTESRYAGIAFRMAESGNFATPYFLPDIPFLGKPPLSFWATAISFKIFGSYHEFFARLPHFLVCLIILYITFVWAKKMSNERQGMISAIILASMAGFQLLAGSIMTDAFLLLGIMLTNFGFFYGFTGKKYAYLFFLGISISVLSKGLIGVVLSGLPCFFYCLVKNKWRELLKFPIFTGTAIVFTLVFPWFYLMQKANPEFLEYFILGEHFQRFLISGWKGDKYGRAHSYNLFTIWAFFFACIGQWILYFTYLLYKNRSLRFFLQIKEDTLFVLLTLFLPLLFFSFSRNIIFTYGSVSIYSAAILLGIHFKSSEKILSLLTIPFAIIFFVALLIGIQFKSTDKSLIFEFEKLKKEEDKLYYLDEKIEFSSYFYARDNVLQVTQKDLQSKHDIFFITSKKRFRALEKNFTDLEKNFTDLEKQEDILEIKCNKKNCLYKKF